MTSKITNAKIRVLHVTGARRVAGTERSLLMLLDHSDRSAFEHAVVCRGSGSLADELSLRNARIFTIRRVWRADPVALLRFAALVIRFKPHVVHIYFGRLEAVIAHMLGIPVVERKNICRNDYFRPMLNFRAVDCFLNRFVDVSITPAAAVRSHYIGRGYDPTAMQVVYNGVEPAPVRPSEARAAGRLRAEKRSEIGVPPDAFLVAFAGRMMPEKGVDVLLSALARLPRSIYCVIMGDGPYRSSYQRQAEELGLEDRVIFTGFRRDVREVFACSDAVAVPSYSEALANVSLEAMAEGRPVVATAVEGMPEAVEHNVSGYLVPPGDPAALAESIAILAADPEAARRIGAKGRNMATRRHSPERMARETESIYRDLLYEVAREREVKCQPTPSENAFKRGSS